MPRLRGTLSLAGIQCQTEPAFPGWARSRMVYLQRACMDRALFSFSSLHWRERPGGFPTCARSTRGVSDRALREHGESPGFPSFLSAPSLLLIGYWRGWPGCPRLRASNEGLPRPRVLRARRAPGHSLPSLASQYIGETLGCCGDLAGQRPARAATAKWRK